MLVQGGGQVGGTVTELLRNAGATVLFNDVAEPAIRHWRDKEGLEFIPSETIYQAECDIFSPCALGGILDAATTSRLGCRAGGANNQLRTPEDAE